MSALERAVIEKFHQQDKAAQERVRKLIHQEADLKGQTDASTFGYDVRFRDIQALCPEIRAGPKVQTGGGEK